MGIFDFLTGKKPNASTPTASPSASPRAAPLSLENNAMNQRANKIIQNMMNQGYSPKQIKMHAVALSKTNMNLASSMLQKVDEFAGENYYGGKRTTRRNRRSKNRKSRAHRKGSRSAHRRANRKSRKNY